MSEDKAVYSVESKQELAVAIDAFAMAARRVLEALVITVAEACERMVPVLAPVLVQIKQDLMAKYDNAGQPYGPGEEAMWRWFREQVETERLRLEAETRAETRAEWQETAKMLEERREQTS